MTHPVAPEPLRVGCVILAAGAGKRFGEPKAAAEISPGVRFIDAVAQTARAAGLDDIVAVMRSGIAPPADVRSIVNPNPDSEQIASLRLGLAQLVNTPARGALVWPVDHPFVLAKTITDFLSFVTERKPLIARPVFNGQHGHPVYFSRDVWRELVTVKNGGAREIVHQFLSSVEEFTVADRGILRDIDSRADL
jgi:CTP:molybdopterin cytidylyltransferase MocA